MDINSGDVTKTVYFVAKSSLDLRTKITGKVAADFTVYRSRDGGALTAYTTPTIAELNAANAPGIYKLLLDEDTTLAGAGPESYYINVKCTGVADFEATHQIVPVWATAAAVAALPADVADAVLDRTDAIETGWTLRKALRIILAVLAGKASGLDTATAIFRNVTDTKDRVTATHDGDGNRSAVTTDAT